MTTLSANGRHHNEFTCERSHLDGLVQEELLDRVSVHGLTKSVASSSRVLQTRILSNSVFRLMQVLALALALCGCAAMDHPHQSTDKNVVIQDTNPPNASASTGATKEPSYLDWSLINRLKIKLNIFGFSYHTDRKGTRECHVDNEFNIGVGFDYKLHDDATGVLGSSVGIYRDSGRNWAKLAGVNYLFKLGDRSKFGADLLLVKSPTYNYGRSLVALIPRLAYDFGPVELNAIYIPKYRDVNQFAVFGIYFSIPLWP